MCGNEKIQHKNNMFKNCSIFKPVGCDGILNSTKSLDKCGKCNGDNLSCHLISGLYTE